MRAPLFVGTLSLLALAALAGGCVGPKHIDRSSAQTDLGAAYYREGDTEGALTTLRGAAKLDPRNWRAYDTLAVVYIAKGELDLADQAFRHARRINPTEGEILNNHGTLLLKTGRTAEAIEAFRAALKDLDYRNIAMVQSNLSYALLQAGQNDEALAWAREATRRAPTLCEAWYHLGLVQEARQDKLAALEAYSQLVTTCPNESIGARLRTGCLQVQVGMEDDGVAALQGVLAVAPGTALADQARECLRSSGS